MPSDALDMEEFVDGEGVRGYGGGGRWYKGGGLSSSSESVDGVGVRRYRGGRLSSSSESIEMSSSFNSTESTERYGSILS